MTSTKTPVFCPVCSSGDAHFQFDCKDHSISKEMFSIWACKKCTHRFTYPVPPESEIGRYYKADHYISHSDTSTGIIARLYKFARKFTLSEKKRFVERQAGILNGQLLEVGTGTGGFLHEMEQSGWKTTGVEPDFQAREKAKLLYKLPVFEPDHIFSLVPESFDAITLWHVLEHIYDLKRYMLQFQKLLKPSGLVFIAVPNYTSVDAVMYKDYWAAYDVPRHLHHFSPDSLQALAAQSGFSIKKQKPMWLDAFYISLLSEQYLHGSPRFISAFFRGFYSVVKTFFNRARCSSLIYVLEKQVAK